MGHEVGHVIARHGVEGMASARPMACRAESHVVHAIREDHAAPHFGPIHNTGSYLCRAGLVSETISQNRNRQADEEHYKDDAQDELNGRKWNPGDIRPRHKKKVHRYPDERAVDEAGWNRTLAQERPSRMERGEHHGPTQCDREV